MLKVIENILKKHLDDAAREYEKSVEMTVITPFEVLWNWPSFEERRALARELTIAIKGVDLSTLRQIPTLEEAKRFLKPHMLYSSIASDDDYIEHLAQELIRWLEYRPQEIIEPLL